jgi:hypothetical protein
METRQIIFTKLQELCVQKYLYYVAEGKEITVCYLTTGDKPCGNRIHEDKECLCNIKNCPEWKNLKLCIQLSASLNKSIKEG